ncbi:MAG: hypothetical protein AB7N80_03830 [Bdellovibrionales bacterium]
MKLFFAFIIILVLNFLVLAQSFAGDPEAAAERQARHSPGAAHQTGRIFKAFSEMADRLGSRDESFPDERSVRCIGRRCFGLTTSMTQNFHIISVLTKPSFDIKRTSSVDSFKVMELREAAQAEFRQLLIKIFESHVNQGRYEYEQAFAALEIVAAWKKGPIRFSFATGYATAEHHGYFVEVIKGLLPILELDDDAMMQSLREIAAQAGNQPGKKIARFAQMTTSTTPAGGCDYPLLQITR